MEVRQGGVRGFRGFRLVQPTRVNSSVLQRILVQNTPSHVVYDVVQVYLFLRLLSGLNLIQEDSEGNVVHAESGPPFYLERTDSYAEFGAEISPT